MFTVGAVHDFHAYIGTNEMTEKKLRVSLGKRLRFCPSFACFGVVPNWDDFPDEAQKAIGDANEVYYASPLYEDLLRSLGKRVFPRNYYRFMGNKIRQTNLFQYLAISHPHTRLYYGRNRTERICRDFQFPFIAKNPIGSSKGVAVWLIRDEEGLASYLEKHCPAYIQEYLSIDRDLRVVLIGGEVVHAYWRIQRSGEFRNNVFQGASISYEGIPQDALEFARDVARRCRFDEVGLDVCHAHGRYYVLEANMVYGLEGFRQVGLDIYEVFERLDREGLL